VIVEINTENLCLFSYLIHFLYPWFQFLFGIQIIVPIMTGSISSVKSNEWLISGNDYIRQELQIFTCSCLVRSCLLSISCNLVDRTISRSDNCARASSFSLPRFLRDWFTISSSSTLVCMSAPCLSNCGIFRNVCAFSESFFVQYVEPECPMNHSEKPAYGSLHEMSKI
jgi:hypothetical protein